MRTSKPTTISLGDQQKTVDAWVRAGDYVSTSEAMRDAVRALAREKEIMDGLLRDKIRKSLESPLPSTPAKQVFSELRAHHRGRVNKARSHEKA